MLTRDENVASATNHHAAREPVEVTSHLRIGHCVSSRDRIDGYVPASIDGVEEGALVGEQLAMRLDGVVIRRKLHDPARAESATKLARAGFVVEAHLREEQIKIIFKVPSVFFFFVF